MTTQPKKNEGSNRTMIVVLVALAAGALLVPCIGVLAAVAIPAFINYQRRAKLSEAETNLRVLYTGAAAYYAADHPTSEGLLTHCTVAPATSPNEPSPEPRSVTDWPESFDVLGFTPADPLRYRYVIVSDGRCGHPPSDNQVYSFRAMGDLDGDGVESMLELAVGSDADNRLMRAPGIYRLQELE